MVLFNLMEFFEIFYLLGQVSESEGEHERDRSSGRRSSGLPPSRECHVGPHPGSLRKHGGYWGSAGGMEA